MSRARGILTAFMLAVPCGLSSVASAASISFNVVSGLFSNNSSSINVSNGNDAQTITFLPAASTFTFSLNDGATQLITLPAFGSLSISANNGGNANIPSISDTFKLNLQVLGPVSATGFATGTITGSLKNGSSNSVTLSLTSVTLPTSGLPDLVFAFNSLGLSDQSGAQNLTGSVTYHADQTIGVNGIPTVPVPLPTAAFAGMSTLAVLGAFRLCRRVPK